MYLYTDSLYADAGSQQWFSQMSFGNTICKIVKTVIPLQVVF
jgi:hypothetical protein